MPWGVPVPTDSNHVMYVWFDALVNYISTLGWPNEDSEFTNFWPGVQIAGKDNLRQQSAMWQAMLMAAKLPPSKQILINGFISIDGQKMSKSLGNVISPSEMVKKYGTDGSRFLLMFLGPIGTDMDTSWEKLNIAYTAHLSNGLGNLCSRVAKLAEKAELTGYTGLATYPDIFTAHMEKFEIREALNIVLELITISDQYLSEQKPWTKTGDEQKEILNKTIANIMSIASMLRPFMPATSQTIISHFQQEKIVALKPLFPRI
jgi:methionyl-tRNA synthetase